MSDVALCTCEHESHGDLGPVGDGERLARLVTSPNHFRKSDGRLKPGVFPLSHIQMSGVSLMRVDHMAKDFVVEVSTAIAAQISDQTPSGLLVQSAEAVRSLVDSNSVRSLCVVDDPVLDSHPLPDNPAHALAISSKVRSEEEILEIQSDLYELFAGALVALEDVHA